MAMKQLLSRLSLKIRQRYSRVENSIQVKIIWEYLFSLSIIVLVLRLFNLTTLPLSQFGISFFWFFSIILILFNLNLIKRIFNKFDDYFTDCIKRLDSYNSVFLKNLPLIILALLLFSVWLFSYPELTYWNTILFRIRNRFKETTAVVTLAYVSLVVWFNRSKMKHLSNASDNKKIIPLHPAIILIICASIGLALRIPRLEFLGPYTDEYAHLNTAKKIVEQNWQSDNYYSRSFYLVTVPVALGFELLGVSLFNARLVGIIIHLLGLIPLYLIGKKIGKPFSVILCLLYATNPWLIATSRTVREYAYFPVLFFSIFLLLFDLINTIPDKFDISNDYKIFFSKSNLIRIAALILFVVYGMIINQASTFKVIYLLYIIAWLFFLIKLDYKKIVNVGLIITQIIVLFIIYYFLLPGRAFLDFSPSLNPYWWGFFYPGAGVQWYGGRWHFLSYLITGIVIFYTVVKSRDLLPKFITASFVGYLYFYLYHFERYRRPRYLISAQLWFLIFFGFGLYLLILLITKIKNKFFAGLLLFLVLLNIFSWRHLVLPITNERHGYVPITQEYHDKVDTLSVFLRTHTNENYEVCYGTMGAFLVWNNFDFCKNFRHFNYRIDNPFITLEELTDLYQSGIILFDFRRGIIWPRHRLPQKDFKINATHIKYLGTIDGNQVYEFGI